MLTTNSLNVRASKQVLLSICLLLVLASDVIMQINAQSTGSVTVCFDLENSRLHVLINDVPFCIHLSETLSLSALSDQINSTRATTDGRYSFPLIGDVYKGTCDDLGNKNGTLSGALTFELVNSDEFIAIINFTMTSSTSDILHSESKFTGNLLLTPEIALKNVTSEYAYFESNGVRVNLRLIRLEPESGAITIDDVICLPAFIFLLPAPVGGIVMATDKLTVLTPYLALAGLITALSTIYVIKRRKG
jgi:hypothetical protein